MTSGDESFGWVPGPKARAVLFPGPALWREGNGESWGTKVESPWAEEAARKNPPGSPTAMSGIVDVSLSPEDHGALNGMNDGIETSSKNVNEISSGPGPSGVPRRTKRYFRKKNQQKWTFEKPVFDKVTARRRSGRASVHSRAQHTGRRRKRQMAGRRKRNSLSARSRSMIP